MNPKTPTTLRIIKDGRLESGRRDKKVVGQVPVQDSGETKTGRLLHGGQLKIEQEIGKAAEDNPIQALKRRL